MLQQLQALVAQLLAYVQAHPAAAFTTAVIALNALCAWGTSKLAPTSKLYHACQFVLGAIPAVLQMVNAVRGMLGKAPIVLGKPALAVVDPDKTPVPEADTDPGRPSAMKAVLLLAAVALTLGVLAPREARAEINLGGVTVSYGPSIPLVQIDLKSHGQVSVAQGAGMMASFELPQLSMAFLGKSWNMLSLDALAYGSLVTGESGAQFGQLLVGGMVTTLNSLLGIGWAHALFAGQAGGSGVLLVAISINFGLAPQAPPVGVERGAAGLVRGNTLYFGSL